jgi:Flp pilus assembly protein TadG
MWLIMFGPVFLVMLYFVVEIGHLYLAKTELNNALEAAAQAGAQRWSQAGATTADARDCADAYARANTVSSGTFGLDTTEDTNDPPGSPNRNVSCTGEIVLGAVNVTTNAFDANTTPIGVLQFGVRIRKTLTVAPLSSTLLGVSMGPFDLSGDVTAVCATGGKPQLIRLGTFSCSP